MLAHDPPRGVTLNPWLKVGGGMGQGTATELTHLEKFPLSSVQLYVEFHDLLLLFLQLYLNTIYHLYLIALFL